jgi:hypothetical protein
MAQVQLDLGSSSDKMTTFKGRKDCAIQYCIDRGSRDVRIVWSDIDRKTLHLQQIREVAYEDPVDEHWDFNLYVAETLDAMSPNSEPHDFYCNSELVSV